MINVLICSLCGQSSPRRRAALF